MNVKSLYRGAKKRQSPLLLRDCKVWVKKNDVLLISCYIIAAVERKNNDMIIYHVYNVDDCDVEFEQ